MPLYRWRAVDETGEIAEGEMEAIDQAHVVERLRAEGRLLLTAEAVGTHLLPPGLKGLLPAGLFARRRLSDRAAASMFRQLSVLLRCGLTLERALETVAALDGPERTGHLAGKLLGRVRAGTPLADAMEAEPNAFQGFSVGMVRAGESAGALPIAVNRVAECFERALEMREGLAALVFYPTALFGVVFVSAMVLALADLPRILRLVQGEGVDLSQLAVVAGGGGPLAWWLPPVVWAMTILVVLRRRGDPVFRLTVDSRLLDLPWVGRRLAHRDAVRFLRGLSTLLACGVPVGPAMQLLRDTVANAAAAATIGVAAENLRYGRPLVQPLAAAPWFPADAARILQQGEETGRFSQAAREAAASLAAPSRFRMAGETEALILALGLLAAALVAALLFLFQA
ncbi:MAG: type II secretion system F family protein [Solirubrobacterales bacterium]